MHLGRYQMDYAETLILFLLAAVAQGLCMAIDELWFHHRRGLGRWERISHPIDTAGFLLCLGLLLFIAPAQHQENWFFWVYFCAAAGSSLLVTKDEWIHAREAPAAEQWLHSVLFILHPLLLVGAWQLFKFETHVSTEHRNDDWGLSLSFANPHRSALSGLFVSCLVFGIYQVSYWRWRARVRAPVVSCI